MGQANKNDENPYEAPCAAQQASRKKPKIHALARAANGLIAGFLAACMMGVGATLLLPWLESFWGDYASWVVGLGVWTLAAVVGVVEYHLP